MMPPKEINVGDEFCDYYGPCFPKAPTYRVLKKCENKVLVKMLELPNKEPFWMKPGNILFSPGNRIYNSETGTYSFRH